MLEDRSYDTLGFYSDKISVIFRRAVLFSLVIDLVSV